MMMKVSFFRLGLMVAAIGIVVSVYYFQEYEKEHVYFELGMAQTKTSERYLESYDVGYVKTHMPSFDGNTIFVQVVDPGGNIIEDKKIQTRMAINYFEVTQDGTHSIKATNLGHKPVHLEIEYGQTNSGNLLYSGAAIFVGTVMVVIAAYRKLKGHYITAQPDENIS